MKQERSGNFCFAAAGVIWQTSLPTVWHVNPSKQTPSIPGFLRLSSGGASGNMQKETITEARQTHGVKKRQNHQWNIITSFSMQLFDFPSSPCSWVYKPDSSYQSDLVQETSREIWQSERSPHFQLSSPHSLLLTSWHQWRTSLLRPNCLVNLVTPCNCLRFPAASLELKKKAHIRAARSSKKLNKKKPTTQSKTPRYFQLPATHITLPNFMDKSS